MNISRPLLCVHAYAHELEGIDADRNPRYGEAIELRNIYITQTSAWTRGQTGKESADTMTLFFDCRHSTPKDFAFKKGTLIEYAGESYTVQQITPALTPKGVHHYEVILK